VLPQGNSGPAWASDRFGISTVADPALLAQPVELKLQSATAKELLSAIARQVGAEACTSVIDDTAAPGQAAGPLCGGGAPEGRDRGCQSRDSLR